MSSTYSAIRTPNTLKLRCALRVPLKVLQAAAESKVPCFGTNREHVRPVYDASLLHAGEAVHEAE
jgi:hypothetical protein